MTAHNKLPTAYTYADLREQVPLTGRWIPAGHNTLARWREDHIELRLHADIVAELHEHHMRLFARGFHTKTTEDRINRCVNRYGFMVHFGPRGHVLVPWSPNHGHDKTRRYRFMDGITIHEDGTVEPAEPALFAG